MSLLDLDGHGLESGAEPKPTTTRTDAKREVSGKSPDHWARLVALMIVKQIHTRCLHSVGITVGRH